MRVDIMTDLETLGTCADSTVFQISAIAFDITTGEHLDTFNTFIDIDFETIKASGATLKWWLNTNPELFKTLLCNSEALLGKTAFANFRTWITQQQGDWKDIYLWGNGILFDNNMIHTQMTKYGLSYPIFYRNDRDVRTILELAALKIACPEEHLKNMCRQEQEMLHNAFDDCAFQIRLVCKCFTILMD